MTSIFRTFVLAVLGLGFATLGLYHAATSFPAPNVFAAFSRDLPIVTAIVSFGLGVLLTLAGAVFLLLAVDRLRRRRLARRVPGYNNASTSRPAADRRHEDFDSDPDADPYAFDGGNGYGGYSGGASTYPHAGRNGRPDRRPPQETYH